MTFFFTSIFKIFGAVIGFMKIRVSDEKNYLNFVLDGEKGSAIFQKPYYGLEAYLLKHISVSEKGKGLGSYLLKESLEYLKELGCEEVLVSSWPWTVGFYKKHGFEVIDSGFDEVILRKEL